MWNIISCKSQYKEYLKKKQDDNLYNHLTKIKPQVDTACPKTLRSKPRKQIENKKPFVQARSSQIIEENRSLLQRMLRIDLQPVLPPEKKITESASLKSLNNNFRRKKLEEIQMSNKQILTRLKSTNSVYSARQWKEFNKFHNYIRDNISRNSGRVQLIKKTAEEGKRGVRLENYSYSLEDSFDNLLIK